jgi:RNA polymerase sigma factor (sigma-70 family)
MDGNEWLADRFEEHRTHLRAVAYRMLGSLTEADDAVQDAWLRLSRAGASEVENLGGWLTTIVARVCLNMLRSRNTRREKSLSVHLPDPIISAAGVLQPEEEAVLADSVGLALLVVLDTLSPAERLAFVLHDMFELPFEEIAAMVGRSPAAARQLASRARRRVKGAELPAPDPDLARQRDVVDAFFLAARGGDFDALVALLDPDVVLRADYGARRPGAVVFRGAAAVASQARAIPGAQVQPALVNGAAGAVITVGGRPIAVMGFTVVGSKIVEIDAIADPERVRRIAAAVLGGDDRRAPASPLPGLIPSARPDGSRMFAGHQGGQLCGQP